MKILLILLVQFYRVCFSPFLPPSCRFLPTCSQYTIDVLNKYGWLKGSLRAFQRLLRCHPWGGKGGYDPA